LKICAETEANPVAAAAVRFHLAEVLWDSKDDKVRAARLAHQARDVFAALQRKSETSEVAAWLASHKL
jgi:hypothetical protein